MSLHPSSDATAPFVIRSYRPGDEDDILRLFALCFGEEVPRAVWSWKFEKNPCAPRAVMLCRAFDGTLIAHCAGMPAETQMGDQEGLAIQVVDAMSHPRFRHVGLGRYGAFAQTVRRATEVFGDMSDQKLFFGFPGSRHLELGVRLLGYEAVRPVTPYVTALPTLRPLSSLYGQRKRFVREVDAFPAEADELWARAAPYYPYAIIRRSRYLNWRYRDCPHRRYRILALVERNERWHGWAVLSAESGSGRLVDFLIPKKTPGARILLRRALCELRREGAKTCELWMSPSSPHRWLFRRFGFWRRRKPSGIFLATRADSSSEITDIAERFHFQMGDSDLY